MSWRYWIDMKKEYLKLPVLFFIIILLNLKSYAVEADEITISDNQIENANAIDTMDDLNAQGQSENIIASGGCGRYNGSAGMIWTLYQDGLLEISGSGEMGTITTHQPWEAVKDQIKQVIIKEGVSSISSSAFSECTNLISVSIPESVTQIGVNAFQDCSNLVDIGLPNSITEIPYAMFWKCTSLQKITIPESVTNIDQSAFSWCEGLQEVDIKGHVKTIPSFENCSKLKTITIPDSVTTFPICVFYGCEALETVILPSSLSAIPEGAFNGCKNLKQIVIPESVKEIGESAFKECSKLESLVLPEGISTIGYNAFADCNNLISINIPSSITAINNSTFSGCKKLTNITIPEGVTVIESRAFCECSSLTEISIPDSVIEIGFHAFGDCSALRKVTLGSGIRKIGGQAFILCYNLDKNFLILNAETTVEKDAFLWSGVRYIFYPGTKEQWMENGSPQDLFFGSYDVTKLAIHYEANDHTWDLINEKKQPTKSHNGKQIRGCKYCNFEKIVSVPVKGTKIEINNVVYTVKSATEVEYSKLKKKNKKVVIPEKIEFGEAAYYVTSIAPKAFYKDTKVREIEIGKNIQKLGKQVFDGCKKLKKVSFKTTVLSSIGEKAFSGCSSLRTLTIQSSSLKKSGVKGGLKGSCITKIKTKKKLQKQYKNIFTKKNCGKVVKIK